MKRGARDDPIVPEAFLEGMAAPILVLAAAICR